jgi:NitT/TauT family transport system permease protein/taurine transport system permease protein
MSTQTIIGTVQPGKERKKAFIEPEALRLLCLAAILLFWEAAPRLEWVSPIMLAPLSTTLVTGVSKIGLFTENLVVTVGSLAAALVIAVGGGAITGLLLGSIRPLRVTLLPIMSSIYAVPLVIVYPVFTAWVGIGTESKIIFGGIYGFFPMLLATAAGVQTIDGSYLLAARSMGATRAQLIRHIMIPAALPSIISGIRIGSAMTTIGVVVAEMMAATAGIGFLITQNRTMFNTAEVYFGVFLVLLLAGAIDWAVRIIEAKAGVRHTRKVQAL